jgi:hypothetical protein
MAKHGLHAAASSPFMVTEQEAIAIVRRIAPHVIRFAASIVAPLYWVTREPTGAVGTRNGTAFFLRTSEALFGVTAAHVIEGTNGWRAHCEMHGKTNLRLGAKEGSSVAFDWDARCVDINLEMDIATFTVSPQEIHQIDRTPYGGLQTEWPPPAPATNTGITYAGFPGVGTRQLSRAAVQFGIVCGTGLVSSVNDRDISTLLEREYLEAAMGEGVVPENYNFGGMSGGPVVYNLLTKGGIFVNALAGVLIAGPNPSSDPNESIQGFELFRARRACFIRVDGRLDHDLWEERKQ